MAEEMSNIAAFRSEAPRLRDADIPLPYAQWTDENLMLEHGRGTEAAFEELVRRFHRSVFNYIYRMVQNRHVGEELTQEVFMALVKNGDRYTPTAKFSTYLYTIASNIVYKEWARQKRRPKMFSLSWWSNDHDGEGASGGAKIRSADNVKFMRQQPLLNEPNGILFAIKGDGAMRLETAAEGDVHR